MHGCHIVKFYSSTQSVISISSGESEFYAAVKGTATVLGQKSIAQDLGGGEMELRIEIDSSAAKTMSLRRGLGKARHIETQYLWIQYISHSKRATMVKIDGADNCSDLGTKHVEATLIRRFLEEMNFVVIRGKSGVALKDRA